MSVLPSVLNKLRDWRLLDPDHRYSPGAIHRLALDLAGITDRTSASTNSTLTRPSRPRLRIKWVGSDSPSEGQDRESSSSTPPSPSPSRSDVLDSALECAHTLSDLDKRRSDARYESCQADRLGTPDSEDASTVVSPRRHSTSGFRSGCSACRHLRLSGPSTPPSAQMTSVPFSNVNQFDMNINTSVTPHRYTKPSVHHTPIKREKRGKHKSSQSISRSARVDENEPPLPKPTGVQQGIGISFPRHRTHSPRISNALVSREPFPPAAASVQRRLEPSHLPNRVRKSDKHTFSHRVASVDLRLSMANHASPIDLHSHAPTRAQSFSYTPVHSHGRGSVGAWVPKLSSNAVESRSSKGLPSWSQSHPHRHPTAMTTSVTPTGSLTRSPAKTSLPNAHSLGTWSRPSSASIPRRVPSDMKHRDRRSVSAQTHKHTQSVGALPSSPLIPARKWQV